MIILKSVVFPAPFGPMTPTMPPLGRLKLMLLVEELVAEALGDSFGLHNDIAQTRPRRNVDFQIVGALRPVSD